jgi:hypothetical protein
MTDDWYVLLKYWQGPAQRHALTFPFILGALRGLSRKPFESEPDAIRALKSLIDDIRDLDEKLGYLHVYFCPDREKLVLRLVNGKPSSISVPIKRTNGDPGSLYATDGSNASSSDPCEDLLQSIWRETKEALLSGRYSCRGKIYDTFTDYDRTIIQKALEKS